MPFMKPQILYPVSLFHCFPPLISYIITEEKCLQRIVRHLSLLTPAFSLCPNANPLPFTSCVPTALNLLLKSLLPKAKNGKIFLTPSQPGLERSDGTNFVKHL